MNRLLGDVVHTVRVGLGWGSRLYRLDSLNREEEPVPFQNRISANQARKDALSVLLKLWVTEGVDNPSSFRRGSSAG